MPVSSLPDRERDPRVLPPGATMETADRPTIGRYRVEGELGRGGMGIVYLGRDPRLGREVALKSLPAVLAGDPAWIQRFTREAKALASLHHPNIGTIHGLQVGSDGAPYLILERAHGETLAHRLEQGRLPAAEALDIAIQIAAALEAAHERGIVHRDLKPGNVMIAPWGRVKVLDFGVAMRHGDAPAGRGPAAPAGSDALQVTHEVGEFAGTPGYMSPEQILGLPQDGRSDVFALGCILFECLTGRGPFAAATLEGVLGATLVDTPELGTRDDVPSTVRELVPRLLDKDPPRRPAGMREVREELQRALASERADVAAPGTVPADVPHNLPPDRDRFIGRSAERAELPSRLSRSRLLTITGPGGSGKTRLALRVGAEMLGGFPDGVWFVDLTPIADPARVPDAVASALGVRAEAGRTMTESLVARLGSRRCLVILDNCEHVMSACTALAGQLLEACATVRVLATSREWLGVAGEEIFVLLPMIVPERNTALDPGAVAEIDSVRLFVERARRLRPEFRIDAETVAPVVALCRRLDGIPLAIELAAAQLDALPLDALDDGLAGAGPVTRSEGPAARQDTVAATIRWSYDHLHDDEQRALQALSVFAGGCTMEAAASVLDLDEFAALDVMTRLVDRSLLIVTPSRSETRYRLLESVRQFASSELGGAGAADDRVERHATFFLRFAERAEPELTGPDQADWLARMDRDHDNLLLAIESSLRRNAPPVAARLAAALYRFWFTRGHYPTGSHVIARVLAQDDTREPSAARAKILWGAGNLAVFQGDRAGARPMFERSLGEYQTLGDVAGTARALNGLGLAAQDGGDSSRARGYFEQSLALFRSIGELRGMGAVIGNLSVLLWYEHEYAAARPLMEEAVEMSRAGGATDNLVQALADLGLLLVRGGEDRDAVAPLLQCLGLVRDLGARRAAVGALEAAAELVLNAGDAAGAARGFGAAASLRTAIGVPPEPYEQRDRAGVLRAVELALGPEACARYHADGAALSFEQAVEEALALLSNRAGPDVPPATTAPGAALER